MRATPRQSVPSVFASSSRKHVILCSTLVGQIARGRVSSTALVVAVIKTARRSRAHQEDKGLA
jgi:hypothetical protein